MVSVTIARAIELKHNPGLISALSKETATMYTTAHDSLESLDPKIFGHWKMYFGLKAKFYLAYVSPQNIREPTNSLKHDIKMVNSFNVQTIMTALILYVGIQL